MGPQFNSRGPTWPVGPGAWFGAPADYPHAFSFAQARRRQSGYERQNHLPDSLRTEVPAGRCWMFLGERRRNGRPSG